MGLFPIAGAVKKSTTKKRLPGPTAGGAPPSKASTAPLVSAGERDYRAESDYRTLSDAEDIKGDKGRFAGAKAHATKQLTKARSMFGGRR